MSRNFLTFLCIPLFLIEFISAKEIVDCRIVTSETTECNPFGKKLIRAKEVDYDVDTKNLIVSKVLSLSQKSKVKVISVTDMMEQYAKVEDSLHFKHTYEGTAHTSVFRDTEPVRTVGEKISDLKIENSISITEESNVISKSVKTHPFSEIKPEQEYGIYKVVSGDVLSRVANKFGISTKELLRLNNLDKKSTLRVGQTFKIPLTQKMVDAILKAEYTIEAGDTLLSIAYKFNIKPKDLVRFNNIKSSTLIREGKKLSLPLPYVVKKLEREKKAQEKSRQAEKRRLAKLKKKKQTLKILRGIGKRKLRVTATAYSSHKGQTDSTPFLAAWNNRLRPGMKIIAVSRDLLTRYGMRNGTRVRIGGLKGYYTVRDKMNKRYKKRIDIYMGVDRRRALRWGRRSVVIYW